MPKYRIQHIIIANVVNSLWPCDVTCRLKCGVNIGSGNGLLLSSNYLNQCWLLISSVAFTWEQFHSKCQTINFTEKSIDHIIILHKIYGIWLITYKNLIFFKNCSKESMKDAGQENYAIWFR